MSEMMRKRSRFSFIIWGSPCKHWSWWNGPLLLGEDTGLGSCEPLVTHLHQPISTKFYERFCFKALWWVYIVGTLTWNSRPRALQLSLEWRSPHSRRPWSTALGEHRVWKMWRWDGAWFCRVRADTEWQRSPRSTSTRGTLGCSHGACRQVTVRAAHSDFGSQINFTQ